MSDNAFFERLQVILGRQHAHVLSPAMEAVLARHRPSTTTTGPPQHSVPSADELSAQPATVPAQRFGLMRKRKDPVDDILQRQPQSATKSTSSLNTAHWSFRRLSEMLDVSWDALRQEFGIVLEVHSFRSAGGLFGLHAKSIRPVRCWDELCDARCEVLVRYLNHRYAFPSPIQAQSLPIAMLRPAQHNDRKDATDTVGAATIGKVDLLGVAETGSGKTMCYLIPALEHIVMDEVPLTAARAELGPLAMVLVPTRELAEQVYAEALRIKEFAASHRTAAPNVSCCAAIEDLKIAKVVGGESATVQHDIISKGVHLLIGTPGQLASLLEERYLSLGNTKFVAIDEADRMVEEMMTDQLCSVLRHCPVPRQTIMFTATMLPECRTIATKFLSPRGYFVVKTPYTFQSVWQTFELFPTTASVGEDDDRAKTAAALFEAKFQRLAQWLAFHRGPMIVFSNEKTTCDLIGKRLRELAQRSQRGLDEIVWGSGETATADARGLGGQDTVRGGTCPWLTSKKTVAPMYNQLSRVIVVHAGLTQAERRAAVQQLQNGDASILVTTDLLARGLDVRGLDLVINFDLPESHHSSGSDSDGELTLMKYIHRIGRTGRAGNKGQAVSFVSLPLDTVKRGSKAAIMLAAIETADGPPPPPRKGVRRDDDDADEAMMPTTKRARDDVDEPPLKSRASVGDQPILAPLFRFLRDCATHSSLCTTEQDFVSRCRSHVLPRFSIPEPLLLTMHSLSKDMVNGAILW